MAEALLKIEGIHKRFGGLHALTFVDRQPNIVERMQTTEAFVNTFNFK